MRLIRPIATLMLIVYAQAFSINAGSDSHSVLDFYGHTEALSFDQQLKQFTLHKLDQKEFDHWSRVLRGGKIAPLSKTVRSMRHDLELDDIGTTLLVDKLVKQHFSAKRPNEATMIKYLVMKNLDYDVILSKTGDRLNCLGNLSFKPGRYIFIEYNNKTYADLDFTKRESGGKHFIFMDRVQTYRSIQRNLLVLPKLNAQLEERIIPVVFEGDSMEFVAVSNRSLTEYLGDLPMSDLGRDYTRLRMSSHMQATLIRSLRSHTAGMSTEKKALFLLSFVQQCVPYGSDYTAYGEERYFYPEQTLMAQAADCEDKTFLLSYLLREVAQLESVALFYAEDEHLSLGVHIPDYRDAYSFRYRGRYFLSVEPTAKSPRLGYASIPLKRVTQVLPL